MATRNERYRPSGFLRPQTILLFLAATLAAVPVAWLYQLLLREIPLIYASLLLTFGLAFGLGFAAKEAVRRGHCRNLIVALVFALPLAAVPLAASHWFEYRHLISKVAEQTPGADVDAVAREVPFGKYLEIKQKVGWKVKNEGSSNPTTFNGWLVTATWICEALILLGGALFGAWKALDEPYCERCNRWCDHAAFRLPGVGRAEADRALGSGDLAALGQLTPGPDANGMQWIELTLEQCGGCKETGFLSVTEKQVFQKGKRVNEKSKKLARHLVLDTAAREKLSAQYQGILGQKLPAA